jgi:hypothetical protein
MDFSNPLVNSMIRQLLTSMGAAAVAAGYLTSADLTAVVGGVMVLISVMWSYIKKPAVAPAPVPPKPVAPVKK